MRMDRVEFYRKHAITPQRWHGLKKRGIVEVHSDGTVDEESTLAAIKANASPSLNHQPGGGKSHATGAATETPPAGTFAASRAEREKYAAEHARLKMEERRGLLIRVDSIMAALREELGRVRTRILAIPAEHADALAECLDAAEIQERLNAFIVDALEELTLGK